MIRAKQLLLVCFLAVSSTVALGCADRAPLGPADTPQVVGAADAVQQADVHELILGYGSSQRVLRLVGQTLYGDNGRTLVLDAEAASRVRKAAIRDKKIRQQSEKLAKVWRAAGLPDLEAAVMQRARELRRSGASQIDFPAASMKTGTANAARMPRTCDEIALDIYYHTVDYHAYQVNESSSYDALMTCLGYGGSCVGYLWEYTYYEAMVDAERFILDDLAFTYSAQGCFGPPE